MTDEPLAWLVSLEGVGSAFAAARDGIDVMLRDRGLRRTTPDTTGESLLRGAHASAVLEGSASTLADVRESGGDAIAVDAVRLSTQLLALVPVLRQSPLQALARMHALAAAGSLADEELGRPRGPEQVERLQTIHVRTAAVLTEVINPQEVYATVRVKLPVGQTLDAVAEAFAAGSVAPGLPRYM